MGHVGEVGVAWVDALYCFHSFVYAPVCRVRVPAEGVDDEGVDAFELLPFCIWDVGAVGDIGEVADAECEDREFAVIYADGSDGVGADGDAVVG